MLDKRPTHTQTSHKVAAFMLVSVIFAVFFSLVIFLFSKFISVEKASTRLIASSCSVMLFFIKFLMHIRWGAKGNVNEKLRTLGADLTFASVSFDITMALGDIKIPNLLSTLIINPSAFYVIAGIITFLVWLFFQYPDTVVNTTPNPWIVVFSSLIGVFFYFGRLFLYY